MSDKIQCFDKVNHLKCAQEKGTNTVISGKQGVGKTHLAVLGWKKEKMRKTDRKMNETRQSIGAAQARGINQKNFDISQTIEELKDVSPDGLTAFSNDLEKIKQFLDAVHERAIKDTLESQE